jgi:ABC-type lipoprotein export system ATPase subunit
MARLELIEITKHYRQGAETVKALDGVTLSFEAGEFVSVVGRSGSGKTTLLDVAGLLLRPTAGRVVIGGEDAGRLSDSRRAEMRGRRIGFVFQEYNLLPALDLLENVTLPLRYSQGGADGRRRALELVEAVGLGDRRHHRPGQLSGGQQQRAAIARALVNRPDVVLLDEPTGAVDSDTAGELMTLLEALNRDSGVTVILVTHDAELAARTQRLIRLKDGRVLSDEAQVTAAALTAVS